MSTESWELQDRSSRFATPLPIAVRPAAQTRAAIGWQSKGDMHALLMQAGVRLDDHIGDFEGLVEIKCPLPLTHADCLAAGRKGAAGAP